MFKVRIILFSVIGLINKFSYTVSGVLNTTKRRNTSFFRIRVPYPQFHHYVIKGEIVDDWGSEAMGKFT